VSLNSSGFAENSSAKQAAITNEYIQGIIERLESKAKFIRFHGVHSLSMMSSSRVNLNILNNLV
jgi:uncharacterized membrane protein